METKSKPAFVFSLEKLNKDGIALCELNELDESRTNHLADHEALWAAAYLLTYRIEVDSPEEFLAYPYVESIEAILEDGRIIKLDLNSVNCAQLEMQLEKRIDWDRVFQDLAEANACRREDDWEEQCREERE